MMSFCAPPLLIAVAAGCTHLCRWASIAFVGRGAPGIVIGVLVAFIPAIFAVDIPVRHRYCRWHDYPLVLSALQQRRKPTDELLITLNAVPSVRYYAGESFEPAVYVPTAAGTVTVPDFDYLGLMQATIRRAEKRCWLLTTSDRRGGSVNSLFRWLDREGYTVRLVAAGEHTYVYDVPQLFAVKKRARRIDTTR